MLRCVKSEPVSNLLRAGSLRRKPAEMTAALFTNVELAPADPILGLNEAFAADPRPTKVNLGVGVYFGEDGKPRPCAA